MSTKNFQFKKTENDVRKAARQRVAAYIRVSTDSADQENSFEAQERYFNRLLQENPQWISAGVYSDYGLSGTDAEKRTGFQRILRHCREGKIDRIICKSISRFSRNTADLIASLQILRDCRVTILFEKEALDTADTTGDFILTTLGAIAQEESRSISGNILWSQKKRFPKGEVRNQKLYGYRYNGETVITESGYRYRDIEIVDGEAEIVRRVFSEAAAGLKYVDIARQLNRDGVRPPVSPYTEKRRQSPAQGQLKKELDEGWTAQQISQMLRRERYTGDVLVQKTYTVDYLTHKVRRNEGEMEQYLVRGHHPAIIDRALFEEVQKILQWKTQRREAACGSHAPRAFSGRLLCAACGRYYHVRNTQNHPIWYCPSASRNNGRTVCRAERVYEEQIIRMFRRAVTERFSLTALPAADDVRAADLFSGRFCGNAGDMCGFSQAAAGFVEQMRERLENVQRFDYMERDRAFHKRRIASVRRGAEDIRKRIRFLQALKDAQDIRKHVLGGENTAQAGDICAGLEAERKRLAESEAEEERLIRRLEYLEGYWAELERDFDRRERAIQWMKGLPEGQAGVVQFLNGMTDEYAGAFALSITVYDPLHYSIHWFDDTRTEVEMCANIEGFRHTAAYFDGHAMKDKDYRGK